MVWIRGSYSTHHPRDKAAREAKAIQEKLKGQMLTVKDITRRHDKESVRKHMNETLRLRPDYLRLKECVSKLDPEDHTWGNEERLREKIRR